MYNLPSLQNSAFLLQLILLSAIRLRLTALLERLVREIQN